MYHPTVLLHSSSSNTSGAFLTEYFAGNEIFVFADFILSTNHVLGLGNSLDF